MQYIELIDTIELMASTDYKDHLAAEYIQTKIRYEKLHNLIVDYHAGKVTRYADKEMENIIEQSFDLLLEQRKVMRTYLNILEIRARLDNLDICTGTDIRYYKDSKKKEIFFDNIIEGEDHAKSNQNPV